MAQYRIGETEAAAEAKEIQRREEYVKHQIEDANNADSEEVKPFVDNFGRKYYPTHYPTPMNFTIETSTYNPEEMGDNKPQKIWSGTGQLDPSGADKSDIPEFI